LAFRPIFFMIKTSTLLHLRIPFSFFLMPVFFFTVSQAPEPVWWRVLLVFFILHFMLYPASNGYNSYFDKDQESIGGLEVPPPVDKELYYTSLILDAAALFTGLFISLEFVAFLLIYGLISKAYSHDKIRLKKYPFTGWLAAGIFQGAYTYLMVYIGITGNPLNISLMPQVLIPAGLCTILLLGSYPMTQVYQHSEDARRGDLTLSRLLGIRGTFIFTTIVFLLANAGFWIYFQLYYQVSLSVLFQLFILPVLIYFISWFIKVVKDIRAANFRYTMRLNMITAICLNSFFILFYFISHYHR
jgi:hypothetical protein